MSYPSIDKLQLTLAKTVFHYAKDSKKASGRALGTLIEVITFYLLKAWGFESSTRIEKGLIEYRNASISHNVEYTLHPIIKTSGITLPNEPPITSSKILKEIVRKRLFDLENYSPATSALLSVSDTLKNSCVIARSANSSLVATLIGKKKNIVKINITEQFEKPFAMVECKRVGVEEGNKKGPQTIEKAKQGAYVARTVSSLQKVRNSEGVQFGVLPIAGAKNFRFGEYDGLLNEIISTNDPSVYKDFILTIGVVSNHGNWFTSDNPNKELAVLRDAYDWLLFLTDKGIATFIDELLLNPSQKNMATKNAFLASYVSDENKVRKVGINQFTKSQINTNADLVLQRYFFTNLKKIERWMNVITPAGSSVEELKKQIEKLSNKNWTL